MGSSVILVIGPDVEDQMARFRVFEETGWVDQYVVSVDVLPRRRQEWARLADREGWYVQDPAGQLHELYETNSAGEYRFVGFGIEAAADHLHLGQTLEEQVFGRDLYIPEPLEPGQKRRRLVLQLPSDHKLVRAKFGEYMPFKKYLAPCAGTRALPEGTPPDLEGTDKFGWMRLDHRGEVIELITRTIPGGFWFPLWRVFSRAWKLKPGVTCEDSDEPGYGGSARKSQIDFDGMRAQITTEAGACWDRARAEPSAFGGIAVSGMYVRQLIHLPREQYIRIIQSMELWGSELIFEGKLIASDTAKNRSSSRHARDVDPWHEYVNSFARALPNDTLMTKVWYRC